VINRIDMSSALARSKRRQNACSGAQIDHAITRLNVPADGVVIKCHAGLIGQHPLMLMQISKIILVELPVFLGWGFDFGGSFYFGWGLDLCRGFDDVWGLDFSLQLDLNGCVKPPFKSARANQSLT